MTDTLITPPPPDASPTGGDPGGGMVVKFHLPAGENLKIEVLRAAARARGGDNASYGDVHPFDFLLAVNKAMTKGNLGRYRLSDPGFDVVRETGRLVFSRVALAIDRKISLPRGWPSSMVEEFGIESKVRPRNPKARIWIGPGKGPNTFRLFCPGVILECAESRGREVAARAAEASIEELLEAASGDPDSLDLVEALAERRAELRTPAQAKAADRMARDWIRTLQDTLAGLERLDREALRQIGERTNHRGDGPPLSRTPGIRQRASRSQLKLTLSRWRAARSKLMGCLMPVSDEVPLREIVLELENRGWELIASPVLLAPVVPWVERLTVDLLRARMVNNRERPVVRRIVLEALGDGDGAAMVRRLVELLAKVVSDPKVTGEFFPERLRARKNGDVARFVGVACANALAADLVAEMRGLGIEFRSQRVFAWNRCSASVFD